MTALTLRLPDEKHLRLRAYASARGTSVNRLLDEITTQALVEFDTETRFRTRASSGSGRAAQGLALLNKAMG
jgi:plasmid stability protein